MADRHIDLVALFARIVIVAALRAWATSGGSSPRPRHHMLKDL